MIRRIALLAALAIAGAIAAGAIAWNLHLRALRSTIAAQVESARLLLAAAMPPDATTARTLLRPGLHVIVVDRRTGSLVDAMGRRVDRRTLPPAPPPGAPGAARRRGATPMINLALAVAHIRPTTVGRDGLFVTIAPAGPALARFFLADVTIVLLTVAFTIALGFMRTNEIARRERRALMLRVDAQRTEAEKYQRFLAEAGHELRTPLTVVSGYIDILGESKEAASLDPRLIDVREVCAEIVATIQRRYPHRALDTVGISGVRIVIDTDDLFDALGNLIENAIRYAPDSPITVESSAAESRAKIRVIDRGPGIPPEDRARIFERFQRGKSAGKPEGLGLGLAIVRRVVERWNGGIALQSEPGETVFTLSFPVADEDLNGSTR